MITNTTVVQNIFALVVILLKICKKYGPGAYDSDLTKMGVFTAPYFVSFGSIAVCGSVSCFGNGVGREFFISFQ